MKKMRAFCILNFAFCVLHFTSCSIPSLEAPECSAAKDVVKQYYSLAIGGDPMSHPEVLAKLKQMRSPGFSVEPTTDGDPYYFSSMPPTSTHTGQCSLLPDGRVKAEATVI